MQLIAVAYDSEALAERALATVGELRDEHVLTVHDAAIVRKLDDGRVQLQQSKELAVGEGVVSGGSIGLLLGLALAVPVAGALVGLAAGGGFAALDRGVSDKRMRKIGATLEPGHAAMFVLADDVDLAILAERLAPYGGTVLTADVE